MRHEPSYKQLEVKKNQTNTNNINETWALLQTTGGKDELNVVFMQRYMMPILRVFIVERKCIHMLRAFNIFSNVPILHYLQAVLFIKIWTIFMNILYNSLKSVGTKDHFRQIKVPGTVPYWKACWCCLVLTF